MTRKKSSPSAGRSLFGFYIRRYYLYALLAFVVFFTTYPLPFIVNCNLPPERRTEVIWTLPFHSSLSLAVFLPAVMVFALTMLFVSMVFLQNRSAGDLYFALPARRETLFGAAFWSGYTLAAVPVVLCGLIVLVTGAVTGAYPDVGAGLVLVDLLYLLIGMLSVYSLGAVVAVSTGTTLNAILYGGVLYVMPLVIYAGWGMSLERMLLGFSSQAMFGASEVMATLSPHGMLALHLLGTDALFPALVWCGVSAGLITAAKRVFVRRRHESAGQTRVESGISSACKCMISLGVGMGFALYLGNLTGSGVISFAGLYLGSSVMYTVMEVVTAQGFKTLRRSLRVYAALVACFTVVALILRTGGLGFQTRVPKAENIRSVTISYHAPEDYRYYSAVLAEPDNVALVRAFHEQLVQRLTPAKNRVTFVEKLRPTDMYTNDAVTSATITYELESGGRIVRDYPYLVPTGLLGGLSPLWQSEEFVRQVSDVFQFEPEDLLSVTVADQDGNETVIDLKEPDAGAILEAIRRDLLAPRQPDGRAVLTLRLSGTLYSDAGGGLYELELDESWEATIEVLTGLGLSM